MDRVDSPMLSLVLLFGFLSLACSSEPMASDHDPSNADLTRVLLPQAPLLISLFEAQSPWSATALAFNPEVPGELWVTLRQPRSNALCTQEATQSAQAACAALRGQIAIISEADSDSPSIRTERDGNAWHFMRRPTSIAFGDHGTLATCGEARTANYEDDRIDFHGPVLWSSNPAIFGVPPLDGQNGTHLDMLHSTPFCMGIAHERDNVYWAFNGQLGALDRYDFKHPHVVGGDDHTDGELLRYVEGELQRLPEVPSHLVLDRERGLLYVADTGNARVMRLDTRSGRLGAEVLEYDGMQLHRRMDGAELKSWIDPGQLERPSGVVIHRGLLLVTDNASGKIHAFDQHAQELRALDTGLGAGALSGLAVGPDEKLYLSDLRTGQIFRIDSK